MVFTWGEMFWSHQYVKWNLCTLFLSFVPEGISKGLTVAIVCDRVVALTAPLRYKIICRPMRVTTIIMIVFIVVASTNLPNIVDIFIYHSTTTLEKRTIHQNVKQYLSRISQSRMNSTLVLVNFLLFDCMPIPIVFVGNIIIIFSLRKRDILASTTSEVQRQRKLQERQLTKLLLTISMLFFLLTCPPAVYRILVVAGMIRSDTTIAYTVGSIHQTLSLTNSAVNFFVYVVMNKKYREGYEAIICPCGRSNGIEHTVQPNRTLCKDSSHP